MSPNRNQSASWRLACDPQRCQSYGDEPELRLNSTDRGMRWRFSGGYRGLRCDLSTQPNHARRVGAKGQPAEQLETANGGGGKGSNAEKGLYPGVQRKEAAQHHWRMGLTLTEQDVRVFVKIRRRRGITIGRGRGQSNAATEKQRDSWGKPLHHKLGTGCNTVRSGWFPPASASGPVNAAGHGLPKQSLGKDSGLRRNRSGNGAASMRRLAAPIQDRQRKAGRMKSGQWPVPRRETQAIRRGRICARAEITSMEGTRNGDCLTPACLAAPAMSVLRSQRADPQRFRLGSGLISSGPESR